MQGKNTQLTDSHQIRSLEVDEFYKYFGMEEKKWCKQQSHERKCNKRILATNKENIDNRTQRKEQNHGNASPHLWLRNNPMAKIGDWENRQKDKKNSEHQWNAPPKSWRAKVVY